MEACAQAVLRRVGAAAGVEKLRGHSPPHLADVSMHTRNTHTRTSTHTHVRMCTHTGMHLHVHPRAQTHMHHAQAHMHACTCTMHRQAAPPTFEIADHASIASHHPLDGARVVSLPRVAAAEVAQVVYLPGDDPLYSGGLRLGIRML